MALSFSLRRDYRNRRQAERSYCTSGILRSTLTFHNSRLSQVSALNRVFEGVEGIDILQVSTPLSRSCLHVPGHLTMHIQFAATNRWFLINFIADRSRFCFTRRHRPPHRQRARSGVQARVPILRRRRGHRVSSTGELFSRPFPPFCVSRAASSVI